MLLFRVKAQLPLPLPRQKRDAAERVDRRAKTADAQNAAEACPEGKLDVRGSRN